MAETISWERARFLRIWGVLALLWIAGVIALFYDDMVRANVAATPPAAESGTAPSDGGTARASASEITMTSARSAARRSMTQTAMVALLPPAGTLLTGLILGWLVSRPRASPED